MLQGLVSKSPWSAAIFALLLPIALASEASAAKMVVSCGGAAMAGGAQLLCSHLDPGGTAQLCTYTWALTTMTNATQVVEGSFLLPPGANNVTVYQGSGFANALSNPIVMCQGKRKPPSGRFK
jgi:hypothetical protein